MSNITKTLNKYLQAKLDVDHPIYKALIANKDNVVPPNPDNPSDLDIGAIANNLEWLRLLSKGLLNQLNWNDASTKYLNLTFHEHLGIVRYAGENDADYVQRVVNFMVAPKVSEASIIFYMIPYSSPGFPQLITGGETAFSDVSYSDNYTEFQNAGWDIWDWVNLAPGTKPSARYQYAMAVDSSTGLIYLAMGNDGAVNDETWEFNISTKVWTDLAPGTKPSARRLVSMVYYAGKLYLYGGFVTGNNDETWEYTISTNVWVDLVPGVKPSARHSYGMTVDSSTGIIYLYGGNVGGSETWSYTISSNTWLNLAPSSNPGTRKNMKLVYYSGKVYLFGGLWGATRYNDLWEYNIVSNNWIELNPNGILPDQRDDYAMEIFNDKIYIMGGFSGSTRFNDVQEYNILNNSWTELANIETKPTARNSMEMKLYNGIFYMFGGTDPTRNDETWKLYILRPAANDPEFDHYIFPAIATNGFEAAYFFILQLENTDPDKINEVVDIINRWIAGGIKYEIQILSV